MIGSSSNKVYPHYQQSVLLLNSFLLCLGLCHQGGPPFRVIYHFSKSLGLQTFEKPSYVSSCCVFLWLCLCLCVCVIVSCCVSSMRDCDVLGERVFLSSALHMFNTASFRDILVMLYVVWPCNVDPL